MFTDVVPLVLPHLSVGDAFRLWHATHGDELWEMDTTLAVLRTRMGLRPKGKHGVRQLSKRIGGTASRCRECAALTQRVGRVCRKCADDFDSPVGQMTRRELFAALPTDVALIVCRRIHPIAPSSLSYPGRDGVYWSRDIQSCILTLL